MTWLSLSWSIFDIINCLWIAFWTIMLIRGLGLMRFPPYRLLVRNPARLLCKATWLPLFVLPNLERKFSLPMEGSCFVVSGSGSSSRKISIDIVSDCWSYKISAVTSFVILLIFDPAWVDPNLTPLEGGSELVSWLANLWVWYHGQITYRGYDLIESRLMGHRSREP